MALILKDRVKETTTVTSTGTATLLGSATGYQTFSVIGTGNTCYYTIASQTANEWEVGLGTYTSPDQLSRDTVLESSNSGSLVNFSAGTKDVFITQPAEKAIYADATNIVNAFGNGSNTISFTSINTSNITATTSNATTFNGTTGAFTSVSGNGVALTAINASNISSGTIADARLTSNVVTLTGTQTLTNKLIQPRVSSTTSITSPLAWNSDNFDLYAATAQATNFTISADAGTGADGEKIIFRITSDATPRVVTFTGGVSKGFKPVGVTLTVSGSNFTYTLTASKTTYFGAVYNAASARWEIVALSQEV